MTDVAPDQFRNSVAADALLARLDMLEDDARANDAETCPALRLAYAASYRKAIGVDPAERFVLRTVLERVRETGDATVDDLIAQVRGQSGNSLSTRFGAGA